MKLKPRLLSPFLPADEHKKKPLMIFDQWLYTTSCLLSPHSSLDTISPMFHIEFKGIVIVHPGFPNIRCKIYSSQWSILAMPRNKSMRTSGG
jgi:hypothetical protein